MLSHVETSSQRARSFFLPRFVVLACLKSASGLIRITMIADSAWQLARSRTLGRGGHRTFCCRWMRQQNGRRQPRSGLPHGAREGGQIVRNTAQRGRQRGRDRGRDRDQLCPLGEQAVRLPMIWGNIKRYGTERILIFACEVEIMPSNAGVIFGEKEEDCA